MHGGFWDHLYKAGKRNKLSMSQNTITETTKWWTQINKQMGLLKWDDVDCCGCQKW
jgi:hypothetical protein